MGKRSAGDKYMHLAKLMDIILVKESILKGHGGKIFLEAVNNAAPIHWSRGYTRPKFFNSVDSNKVEQRKFNLKSKRSYKRYISHLKKGYSRIHYEIFGFGFRIPNLIMTISESAINYYLKKAQKINYY